MQDHEQHVAAQMRQPGRRLYEHFNDRTWSDLLDELLSEDMFQLEQEVPPAQERGDQMSDRRKPAIVPMSVGGL